MIVFFRPTIINNKNIPINKKVILAGNHTSVLDAFLLMSSTKRHIHFLAKKELFKGFIGLVLKNMGLISVDRKAKDKSDVLINATKYLENDKIVLIFPEGTTEKDKYPKLLPFKKGAVRLSYDTDTEIIPFKIVGRYKLFRKNVKIIFGNSYKSSSDIYKSNKELFDIIDNMKE